MQVSPLYWPLSTLAFATVGLVVGGGVYLALRAIEKWDKPAAEFINILGIWCIVAVMGTFFLPLLLLAVPLSFVLGSIGARFHRNSKGNSNSWGDALCLMMFASLLTISIECLMWVYWASLNSPYSPPQSRSLERILFHCFLLLAPIVLTPFLLWMYQNLRQRPGLDRHLEAGEEDSNEPIA